MPKTPKCPRCGTTVRMKPGTKRTDPHPLFQCPKCVKTHPESCEWPPGIIHLTGPEDFEDEQDMGNRILERLAKNPATLDTLLERLESDDIVEH